MSVNVIKSIVAERWHARNHVARAKCRTMGSFPKEKKAREGFFHGRRCGKSDSCLRLAPADHSFGGVVHGTSLEKQRPAATAPAPSKAKTRKQGKMCKLSNAMRRFGIALSMAAITVPHTLAVAQTPTVAAEKAPAEAVPTVQDGEFAPVADVIDFRLGDGGLLVGEVRNQAGRLLPGRTVRVLFEGKVLASAKTDSRGNFRMSGLREGEHDVEVCDCAKRYRLWSAESAPPKSEQHAKLVCCEEVAVAPRQAPRPQRFRPLKSAFANYPIATAALVVAGIGSAIAIPLSVGGGSKPASP